MGCLLVKARGISENSLADAAMPTFYRGCLDPDIGAGKFGGDLENKIFEIRPSVRLIRKNSEEVPSRD